MEDFFAYRPRVIGFVLNVYDHAKLRSLKNEIIRFASTLEASTEDKVYVYRPGVTTLNRWMGECVADVAGYSHVKADPQAAMSQTISVLSLTKSSDDKHVFYVFDRSDHLTGRRLERGMHLDLVRDYQMNFWLIDLCAKPCDQAIQLSEDRLRCGYVRYTPTAEMFQQLTKEKQINVEDIQTGRPGLHDSEGASHSPEVDPFD